MAGGANNDKKVFDVAKPGKTPPASTARPVIVGHRTMVQDPMMSSASAPEDSPEPENSSAPLAGRGKTLIPVSEHEEDKPAVAPKSKEKVAPKEEPTPPADKTPKPEEPPAEEPKDQEVQPDEPSASVTPVDEAAQEDQEATSAALKKKEEEEKALVEAERIGKLAASKKYALPIREASGRSLKRTALVGLVCFVVGAAGLYLAADAKLLGDITVPVDLVKTEPAAPAVTTPPANPAAGKKSHVLSQYGVSFQYTGMWKQTSDTNDQTNAGLVPSGQLTDQEEVFLLSIAPQPAPTGTTPHTIAKVTYTDVNVKAGKKLYLRELMLYTPGPDPQYRLFMSLSDQKLQEAAGGTTSQPTTAFTAPDGKSPISFYALMTVGDKEGVWFTSQAKAEAYTKTGRYLAARNVLLSTKFTK